MSSRVLRDDLWTSETINSLHDKTFRLYLCLINAADDFGLVDTSYGAIRRAAPLLGWNREEIAKMLAELTDTGAIRPYEVAGKPFAAIEKWRAYVKSVKPKHPMPSFGMGHCRAPYGFKTDRVKVAASLILKHLDIERASPEKPQDAPGDSLEENGVRGKGKGVREKRKRNTPSDGPGFTDFWDRYPHFPNRSSKAESRERWIRMNLEPIANDVMRALQACLDVPQWTRDSRAFVSAAEVWLRKRLWEQDLVSAGDRLIESITSDPRFADMTP